MSFDELVGIVRQYMLLGDDNIVKVLCAGVQANKMNIPPPWLAVIGSSSGGKSMLLDSLHNVQGVTEVDDLTTNTFMSGFKGKAGSENSLLYSLPPNPILMMKDFTTFLSKEETSRGAIAGQLRRLFDGDFFKSTGTTGQMSWEGKIGFICGSTTSIYTAMRKYAAMGERMILYHLSQPNPKDVARWATKHNKDFEAKQVMREAFATYLNNLPVWDELPAYPEELHEELIDLADLATKARSSIERDEYSRDKDPLLKHDREMPVRLLKNIMGFGYGMMSINGKAELTNSDKKALYHMALSSIPMTRKLVMNLLTEYREATAEDVSLRLRLSRPVIDRTLDDLVSLDVVDKERNYASKWVFRLKLEYRALLSKYEHIDMTEQPMTDSLDDIVTNQPVETAIDIKEANLGVMF